MHACVDTMAGRSVIVAMELPRAGQAERGCDLRKHRPDVDSSIADVVKVKPLVWQLVLVARVPLVNGRIILSARAE
ncbi:hypothetical protein MPC4_70193 [Methylocella tundrae]|uniref:Uncharacterized protein n=1 Tax=Methylocella tundrae TaxID=227605 RepID=A0A8B6MCJ2_METTU|nr:hypothetical protein MPC1_10860002 [Methylocella tundrae]VTZ52305.1 hypothetical protein MPC4_70193 [Methylocella tundrae]